MILSDKTILSLIGKGTLVIEPIEMQQIQPASIDIRLDNTFSIVEDSSAGIVTLDKPIVYKEIKVERYLLLPRQFVLATTMAYIKLSNDMTAFKEEVLRNGWGCLSKQLGCSRFFRRDYSGIV